MKYLSALLVIASLSTFAAKDSTPVIMQRALNNFIKLLPLSINEMKFTDPNFEKEIKKNLDEMYTNFQQAEHSKDIRRTTLQPSYQVLLEQLEDAKLSFDAGNKSFARLRLNEVGYLCLSCHTQFSKDKLKSQITNHDLINKKLEGDDFSKANIQLILRDYEQALKTYQGVIKKRIMANTSQSKTKKFLLPQNQLFDSKLYKAIHNSLMITTKVYGDVDKGLALLESYRQTYNLPNYVLDDIKGWEDQLKDWKPWKEEISEKKIDPKMIKRIISKLEKKYKESSPLTGDFDIDLMMMSGILSKYYLSSPQNVKQGELLYWMAMTEYRLGKNMFYSLGDIYLKQCIHAYGKSKTAKKCYDAYEEEVRFRHTGSAGVFLPENVKKELKSLKELL